MTDENAAMAKADILSLRLVLAFCDSNSHAVDDVDRDIDAFIAEDTRHLRLLCCSLAYRAVSALDGVSIHVGDGECGARLVAGWLQRAVDEQAGRK